MRTSFKKALIIIFFFVFLTLLATKPCLAQVDLLDYMASNAGGANIIQDHDDSLNPLGQEFFYSYFGETNSATGRESFYIVKNLDGSNFEEYNYDAQYIYRMKDTSWATGPNQDVTCNDTGDEAYFSLINGSHGSNACSAYHPSLEGGIIAPRHMNVGETFGPHPLTVIGFSEITCECCPTNYSGDITQYMTLLEVGSCSFPTGWSSSDCIKLQAGPPGGGGEVYYYARGYGFVGFEGAGMRNYIVGVSGDQPSAILECFPFRREVELPPNRRTEFGDAVYGRNIPCRPLVVSQHVWSSPPKEDFYFRPYFYNDNPLSQTSDSGFPFDYSPWRPYPGDSGRAFYNRDGTLITDPSEKEQNLCYDLEEVGDDGEITTYCNPAPEITDIIQWFPEYEGQERYFRLLSKFRAWWIDHPGDRQATQIPFLGNSWTSSREFTEYSQRMSLFVADFLRGTAFWDRKSLNPNKPLEFRRILDESGPIRKLFPRERFNTWTYRDVYLQCRLFKANCPSENRPYPLLHTDPIHDYILAYEGGREESDFSNLPDRRSGATDSDKAYRLSAFYCGLRDVPALAADLCPEGDYGNEMMGWIMNNIDRFPLTTREDVPVIVDVSFEGVWEEVSMGSPRPPGIAFSDPPTMDEYYRAIEQTSGLGYHDLGRSSELVDPSIGAPLPVYRFHFIDLVSIPYVAESRELAEWAGLPLTPYRLDWKSETQFNSLKMLAQKDCEANEIVRGGAGDTLAGDWRHDPDLYGLDLDGDGTPDDPYGIGNEWERWLQFLNESTDIAGPGDWWCDLNNPSHFPNRKEVETTNESGKITTKIPFLKTLAKRTIGEAGVFKALMPSGFIRDVRAAIDSATDGKIYWWELPGYGPANFEYDNGLKQEDKEDHWGCCEPGWETCQPYTECTDDSECEWCDNGEGECIGDPGYCRYKPEGDCDQIEWPPGTGQMHDAPCECAGCDQDNCGPVFIGDPPSDLRGWGETNTAEARFYYPYIGSIDIFRKYFMNQLVPNELVEF